MTLVQENWQTKCSTIPERTAFIFNTELLSDVKFVVPVSIGVRNNKRVIPAHKFVLAISSPVFYAMLYGQMAETKNSIELPDCEYESLLEMFRYLYSDKVNLSGDNVMQVLYLANKYILPSLIGKCAEYLRHNLKASNVFCILSHAEKFEDKDLKDRCWKVIEEKTEEALKSDEFDTVERSLVDTVVKREGLNVKEVELFKAFDRWATEQCKRQGITANGVSKRRILGEEIVKAIRFPLMSQQEFALVVINTRILTLEEVSDMMKHYNGVLTSSLPFVLAPRTVQLCRRFRAFKIGCLHDKRPRCLNFSVNKPIMLHGVQHFGSEGGNHTVYIEVKDTIHCSSLVKQSGSYASELDKTWPYYCFTVKFDKPVFLRENRIYKLVSIFKGPSSYAWYGTDGQKSVECQGVLFTFFTLPSVTFVAGQFPVLFWSEKR